MLPLEDSLGRPHSYLRVSVTDRCNYRCQYCMPKEGLSWMPRDELLCFEEIVRVVEVMSRMGIRKVRITGGEPTLRADIEELISGIASIPGIHDLAMTTNGHTLPVLAGRLAAAGLNRVNISIDSVNPEVFSRLTRGGDLERVLAGIDAARAHGLTPIRLNVVLLAGDNEHELFDIVEHFAPHAEDTEIRFIEYMPFEVRRYRCVPAAQLRARLAEHYTLTPERSPVETEGPSRYWRLEECGLRVGFISPLTEHFCASCNRLRLMVDGHLRTCLAHEDTPSLRDLVRAGASDTQLDKAIRAMVLGKPTGHDCQIDGGTLFEGVMTAIGG